MNLKITDRAGLQPERTALAWQRTAVSACIAVLPLLVVEVRQGHWVMGLVTGAAALVIAAFVILLRRRMVHLSADRLDLSPYPDMARVWVATMILAALGVVVVTIDIVSG